MKWVLRPSERLMGRLPYVAKFAIFGLVLLLPLIVIMKSFTDGQQIRVAVSTKERAGLTYAAPLVELTFQTTLARTQAVGFGGHVAVDQEVSRVDAADGMVGGTLDATKPWQEVKRLLADAAAAPSAQDAYDRYNKATAALLHLVIGIGDRSNLTLDSQLDSDYMMNILLAHLPLIVDTAGRMSDRADLARQTPTQDPTAALLELSPGQGVIEATRDAIDAGVKTAIENTADGILGQALAPRVLALDTAVSRFTAQLETALRTRDPRLLPVEADALVRDAASGLADVAAHGLDRLLATRIDGLNQQALELEMFTVAAVLAAVYLFGGFYLSVATPVRRLVAGLHAVARGDLTQVVQVDTRDELSYVARVLNETVARTRIAVDSLAEQATHDSLTGLPNRVLVLDRIDHALTRIGRTGRGYLAVLFMDLDDFKAVNDILGHEAGDGMLIAVAHRLATVMRATDTIGRLAGDEFVVVCEDLGTPTEAVQLAQRIVDAVASPFDTSGNDDSGRVAAIGASVGVAVARPEHAASAAELIHEADIAMYQAKRKGGARVALFDVGLRAVSERRQEIKVHLRLAVERNELRLHYQPILETASGALTGFEALLRWEHPFQGLLSPAEFLPIAEETDLMGPIGAWVVTEACRQMSSWRAATRASWGLSIAVNVSMSQLAESKLVDTVAAALASSGLVPNDLHLEITETALTKDEARAARTLHSLRALGVRLAMDDFGTGYSSLEHLRLFRFDLIKLDRSLIRRISTSAEDVAVVELALQLARSLHLDAIAEGVETTEQLEVLRRLGCPKVQGYLLGRPMPANLASAAMVAGGAAPAFAAL